MIVALAFLSGIGVTAAAVFAPHARNPRSSVQEFEAFQHTLSALPMTQAITRAYSQRHNR